MEKRLLIRLNTNPEQLLRLKALQQNFVEICNAIAPIAADNRCWNRVILHHMVYHQMRKAFPHTGSQMICNAIYSVCRACRVVLQDPKSPWNVAVNPEVKLPRILFLPQSPVFFDRHTLNLKGSQLSMYTLDGRIRFALELSELDQKRFHDEKLKEVMLVSDAAGFSLHFHFGDEAIHDLVTEATWPDNLSVTPPQPQRYINLPMVTIL